MMCGTELSTLRKLCKKQEIRMWSVRRYFTRHVGRVEIVTLLVGIQTSSDRRPGSAHVRGGTLVGSRCSSIVRLASLGQDGEDAAATRWPTRSSGPEKPSHRRTTSHA